MQTQMTRAAYVRAREVCWRELMRQRKIVSINGKGPEALAEMDAQGAEIGGTTWEPEPEKRHPDVYFDLDRDGATGGYQLSIGDEDTGFRIVGPKYCGQSTRIHHYRVTEEDNRRIRGYLDRAFPPPEDPRDATIQALAKAVDRLAGRLIAAGNSLNEDEHFEGDGNEFILEGKWADELLSRLGVRP